MKTILITAAIMMTLVSCGNRSTGKDSSTKQKTQAVADTHNSRNSLDYAGIYEGVTPCADCEGIKVVITLDDRGNYTKEMTYLGKGPNNVFTSQGKYEWDTSGSNITLKGESGMNIYKVGENRLFMLDQEGKIITGDLADKYILTKK